MIDRIEYIEAVLRKKTRFSDGNINVEELKIKANDLLECAGEIPSILEWAERELAKARIHYVQASAPLKFKSSRELSQELDERCPYEFGSAVRARSLEKQIKTASDLLRSLLSYMKDES